MSGPDEVTGPSRLVHQFELAMAVRARASSGDDAVDAGLSDALLTEIARDAVGSDRLDRFLMRQASLPGVVADVAGHMVRALLSNRAALEQALARLDAGHPLTPADVGLDGDGIMKVVGHNINNQGTAT